MLLGKRIVWLGVVTSAFAHLGTAHARLDPYVTAPTPAHDRVLFEADAISQAKDDSPIIAKGNVQAYFGDHHLRADEVQYDQRKDLVVASGNVAITHASGETFFAEKVQLTGDLATGVSSNFSALLTGETRIAGTTSTRRSTGNNTIRRAVYSACKVCADTGEKKTPLWQVKSLRIIQDKKREKIHFQHARLEVMGIPILYTPYFQIPDPEKERVSGFLTPTFSESSRLGSVYEVPYHYVISPHQDITFAPKHTSDNGTLLKGEYRLRTHRAGLTLQPGFVRTDGYEETISRTVPENRFHLFGEGFFNFKDKWSIGFDADYVSDKYYLRSYDLAPEDGLAETFNLFRPDRLDSRFGLDRRGARSLLLVEALGFQSLRSYTGRDVSFDVNDYTAQALPRLRYMADTVVPVIGGVAALDANFLALARRKGLSTQRAVMAANWTREHTSNTGHALDVFVQLRADAYAYQNITDGIENCNPERSNYDSCRAELPGGGQDDTLSKTRFLPTIGAQWSLPLIKYTRNASFIVTPRLQLVASPNRTFADTILNEDSQFFELDINSLFDYSKGSGYDLWESGERANIGLTLSAQWQNGLDVDAALGQQFRREETSTFRDDSGLNRSTSDLVGSFSVAMPKYLTLHNVFRYDQEENSVRRMETNLRATYGPASGGLNYVRSQARDLDLTTERNETIAMSARYRLTPKWYLDSVWREDLNHSQTTQQGLSLGYRDECTFVKVTYQKDIASRTGDEFTYDHSVVMKVELQGIGQ